MSCDELKELYELYILGAVDEAERREMVEHLVRRCPNCLAGIREARVLAASLALAAPSAEPPRGLRHRVVSAVTPAPIKTAGWTWLTPAWTTLAVLMLAAGLWYAYLGHKRDAQIAELSQRLAEAKMAGAVMAARNKLLTDALAVVNLPDARQLVFGSRDPQPPRGRIWLHPQRGVVLLASRLPAAPAGKIYEMWILRKAGPPVPAGLFNSNERGEATHVWPQEVDLAATAGVAVTLEPEAGVSLPTSEPVIAATAGL